MIVLGGVNNNNKNITARIKEELSIKIDDKLNIRLFVKSSLDLNKLNSFTKEGHVNA